MANWLASICTHPIIILMIGGGMGTNARYWLGKLVRQFQGQALFPWATFVINVSGSMVLGLLAATYLYPKGIQDRSPSRDLWFLLLGTGFCGGFTTFSTFSLETYELISEGKTWIAALYVLGSVGGGLLGVWLAVRFSTS